MKPTQQYNHAYGIKIKIKTNKDKHGAPPTKRFSLLGSLVARLEALPYLLSLTLTYPSVSHLIVASSSLYSPLNSKHPR